LSLYVFPFSYSAWLFEVKPFLLKMIEPSFGALCRRNLNHPVKNVELSKAFLESECPFLRKTKRSQNHWNAFCDKRKELQWGFERFIFLKKGHSLSWNALESFTFFTGGMTVRFEYWFTDLDCLNVCNSVGQSAQPTPFEQQTIQNPVKCQVNTWAALLTVQDRVD